MKQPNSRAQIAPDAFAEFHILGTIFAIAETPGKITIGLRANYRRRDNAGHVIDAPAENHVVVVNHATRRFLRKYAAPGQLAYVRGKLTAELLADQFILLPADKSREP